MGKRLEELGLDLLDRLRHGCLTKESPTRAPSGVTRAELKNDFTI
jgi:hypothetical protein